MANDDRTPLGRRRRRSDMASHQADPAIHDSRTTRRLCNSRSSPDAGRSERGPSGDDQCRTRRRPVRCRTAGSCAAHDPVAQPNAARRLLAVAREARPRRSSVAGAHLPPTSGDEAGAPPNQKQSSKSWLRSSRISRTAIASRSCSIDRIPPMPPPSAIRSVIDDPFLGGLPTTERISGASTPQPRSD